MDYLQVVYSVAMNGSKVFQTLSVSQILTVLLSTVSVFGLHAIAKVLDSAGKFIEKGFAGIHLNNTLLIEILGVGLAFGALIYIAHCGFENHENKESEELDKKPKLTKVRDSLWRYYWRHLQFNSLTNTLGIMFFLLLLFSWHYHSTNMEFAKLRLQARIQSEAVFDAIIHAKSPSYALICNDTPQKALIESSHTYGMLGGSFIEKHYQINENECAVIEGTMLSLGLGSGMSVRVNGKRTNIGHGTKISLSIIS